MKIDRQRNIEREIESDRKRHTEKNQKIYTNKEREKERERATDMNMKEIKTERQEGIER